MKSGLAVLVTPAVERKAANMFLLAELSLILGGTRSITDEVVKEWELHTRYEGGLDAGSQLVRWFWEAVRSFSHLDRSRLLAFCTGCPNPPALGFERLPGFNGAQTRFTLVVIASNSSQLPTASTCFAKLKLPRYGDAATLRSKGPQKTQNESAPNEKRHRPTS